jgi:cytoskeletal protein RodZ
MYDVLSSKGAAMHANTASSPSGWLRAGVDLELEARRKSAGLTLEQIADSTKISIRFLRAIENEDFEQLPGGIFLSSYLRQYAEAIGYPAERLLAAAGVGKPPEVETVPNDMRTSVVNLWRRL